MEQIYALGITCIQFVQEWFRDYDTYFSYINDIFSPGKQVDIVFPLVAVVDSVFAAQLLLSMTFGGWLNSIMKWALFEDRPYWWVQETTFYTDIDRPVLYQTTQTCETGPGSPSGHSSAAAMAMLLVIMWSEHIVNDRKYRMGWWWKYILYTLYGTVICSVVLARMYAASHFPHQCFAGVLVGTFLAPALCIYISDPYIWRYGRHSTTNYKHTITWHVVAALVCIAIGFVTYFALIASGRDPQSTIKLAFRWCRNPDNIHVSTTPIFALVRCCGGLLGWALCVTPDIAKYRHYTKNRSIIISLFSTVLIMYGFKHINDSLCTDNAKRYYIIQYMLSALEPMMYLRVVPYVSMWLFTGKEKIQ